MQLALTGWNAARPKGKRTTRPRAPCPCCPCPSSSWWWWWQGGRGGGGGSPLLLHGLLGGEETAPLPLPGGSQRPGGEPPSHAAMQQQPLAPGGAGAPAKTARRSVRAWPIPLRASDHHPTTTPHDHRA